MPRGRPCKCPYEKCGSTSTVSKGARKTKTMGIRKIRLCKECGRKFTPRSQKLVPMEPVSEPVLATQIEQTQIEDPETLGHDEPQIQAL